MCDLFYIKYSRMLSLIYFFLAALAEISGCFAFWAWQRLDKSIFGLLPGSISLLLFAWLLSLTPTHIAGRSYAIYGGIYICCSLGWSWLVVESIPDKWDIVGATLRLLGAAIILLMPRG